MSQSGHAYEAKGHVLFSVKSFEDYGLLSGRSIEDMIAGARVEIAPYKADPLDFVCGSLRVMIFLDGKVRGGGGDLVGI